MTDTKFTPGPWRVEENTTLIWGACNADDTSTRGMGYPIAEARINPSGNWSTGPFADEGDANARLIAAAPEMYEALERLLNPAPGVAKLPAWVYGIVKPVLAKAEGRSND